MLTHYETADTMPFAPEREAGPETGEAAVLVESDEAEAVLVEPVEEVVLYGVTIAIRGDWAWTQYKGLVNVYPVRDRSPQGLRDIVAAARGAIWMQE